MSFAVFLCLFSLLLCTTARDLGNRIGHQNGFYKITHSSNRQIRQVFVFPEGDSRSNQSFRRNRQFGNNRGFTWGASNTNNNNNNNNRRRFPTQNDIRPTEDLNDVLIFDQNDGVGQQNSNPGREFFTSTTQRTPTSTVAIPGMGTTRSACEDACLTTPEYNPVCGNDGITYFSKARLRCAQKCGKRVGVLHIGACPRMP